MKFDLEAELKATQWIIDKCKVDAYAQNVYAALCNVGWIKVEVVPILKEEEWSCSWRYAGGLVAGLRNCNETYMDWYCSGIRDVDYDEEVNKVWDERKYVREGVVTEEIEADFAKLGWAIYKEY